MSGCQCSPLNSDPMEGEEAMVDTCCGAVTWDLAIRGSAGSQEHQQVLHPQSNLRNAYQFKRLDLRIQKKESY